MPAKSQSVTVSVTLDAKVERRLKASARKSHRSLSEVTAAAIEGYLEEEAYIERQIDAGIDDADHGRLISHEEVKAWLMTWGTKKQRPTLK